MSKKRGKSSSAAGQGRWEAALLTSAFEEENWKANIQFVVENDLLDETHVKALANVVKIPQRRLFSFLHKDDLMNMVNELGNPKNKKPAKVPQFYEVTEIIYGLLNANQDIPLPLWAKLIKFGLINIKDTDMTRREDRLKGDKEKTDKGSGKKRPRSKSPGKTKGKKTPEPQLPKKDWSTLKKRGEDDDDNKFIDDEPDDGPQHYIFVSGFRQPQLLPILGELGVNVNGIIKVQSDNYDSAKLNEAVKQPSTAQDDEAVATAQAKRDSQSKELALFWKLLPVVLGTCPPSSRLQDMGVFNYVVAETLLPADWEDADNMVGFGTALFEDLACQVYDSLDAQRQYLTYLKNLNLLHVPVHGERPHATIEEPPAEPQHTVPSATGKRDKGKNTLEPPSQAAREEAVTPIVPPLKQEVDTRYYHELMSNVPMESVSVSLVMHCMLEQVVATETDMVLPSEKEPSRRPDGIHLALAECIADALEGLCLTDDEEKAIAEEFPTYKAKREAAEEKNVKPSGPLLLQYGDDSAVRTHHLKESDGFEPKLAEEAVLRKLPYARFANGKDIPNQQVLNERSSRLHELFRYATSAATDQQQNATISNSDVDRALRQFVLENMELSKVDENGLIQKPKSAGGNLWDDPYLELVEKLKEINAKTDHTETEASSDAEKNDKEKADPSSVTNELDGFLAPKRNYDGYSFKESFNCPVLLQVLEEAHQLYPCMDTYKHKRDNSTLVIFHNPMSGQLKGDVQWQASLHSDVGFRNYLEHVAGSISEWTKLEEKKYQTELVAQELERARVAAAQQANADAGTPPPTSKRPRSKSPKKGSRRGSASRSSSKIGGQEETQQFSSPFVHPASLKASAEILAKQKEEEEKMRKEKEAKQATRGKSSERGKQIKSAASKTSQDGKRPGSGKRPRSGRKSKSRSSSRSSSRDREDKEEKPTETPKKPKLPFTGYDVGNNLIHVRGTSSYLYPCDGGTIKSERTDFEQGQVSVKTTLYKDGHVFVLHILDPKDMDAEAELDELLRSDLPPEQDDNVEKADVEGTEKEPDTGRLSAELLRGRKEEEAQQQQGHSLYGSWSATLCDGMSLALSTYGEEGICQSAAKAKRKLLQLLGEIPPASTPTPVPPGMETPKKGKKSPKSKSPRGKSPKGGKKKSDAADKEAAESQRLEELRVQEELERKLREADEAAELERKRQRMPAFQQLYISSPDGLCVRYQLDPTTAVLNEDAPMDEYKMMVRQSYPYKTSGKQHTEQARAKPAMDEVSRTIQADGTVIKVMRDGSTKVLLSNGTVCFNPGSGTLEPKIPNTPHSVASIVSPQATAIVEEQRAANSAGSKKGSRGRKSSGKTNPAETATDPSVAGTTSGTAAGLEAEAKARSDAEQERASSWITTYITGEVTVTKSDGSVHDEEPLLYYVATDPVTAEVMYSREDRVIRVDRPGEGGSVCDHVDGTRITRYSRGAEQEPGEEEDAQSPRRLLQFVRVECPGFATVTFNEEDQSCVTTFGSGTSLLTNLDGTYQLSHWNGGRLDIAADAAVIYTPRPDNDLLMAAISAAEAGVEEGEEGFSRLPPSGAEPISLGSYLMRHDSEICCEAVDQEGNVFQVKKTGEASVMNPGTPGQPEGSNTAPKVVQMDPMDHHPPRLFVVNSDGSGTELLRLKDVQEYIGDAHLDPATAVIKEAVPEDSKVIGISVLRPHYGNSGDAWLVQKEEENIVPKNIRTRDLTHFPPTEAKKPGPPFGTTVGKGLAVGSAPIPFQPPPAPICPSALELRQIIQYEPLSTDLRRHLHSKLIEFSKATYEAEKQRSEVKVQDPRTAEEQMRASDLLSLVLEFDEELTPRTPDAVPVPSGSSMGPDPKARGPGSNQFSKLVKQRYEHAVAPQPPPKVPPPREKLTQADWDRIRREVEEEKSGREALKNRDVPDYFDSETGRAWLLAQANDMKSASLQLSSDPRRDGTEARMFAVRENSNSPSQDASQDSASSRQRGAGARVSDTPSKMRPTNPTPAHAIGGGTPTKLRPDNPTPIAAAQQRNMRPSNPTPSHASSAGNGSAFAKSTASDYSSGQQYQPSPIPENPTSAQKREAALGRATPNDPSGSEAASDNSRHNNGLLPLETESSDIVLTRSLVYDVTGQPRKERVLLPMSIISDRPGAVQNSKFAEVEEPVRRKVNTSSIAGGVSLGNTKVAERGFQVMPPEVVFGVLREGSTYAFTVKLKNTGIDLCRFKVKQPPPGTGLRVGYTPGPVAAGMEATLNLEIYAIAVGVEGDSGVGTVNHQLEIVTETDIIYLPVTAIVLTAHDFDNRNDVMPPGGKAPGVKLCSNKPPSRDGILRPVRIGAS